jgi:ABC-type antimicrobial peptide transport system permease subunit
VFALFAFAIVGAGLFGVLSYSVSQRSKDIAVQSALGATPGRIISDSCSRRRREITE